MPRVVLQVLDSLDGGGAEAHVVDLSRALAARGRQVVVACSAGGRHRAALEAAGVPVAVVHDELVKRRRSPAYAQGLRALVERVRPDVVHAHMHASEVAAAGALAGSRVPLVLTEHTEAPWRDAAATAHLRSAAARADRVVAVSGAVAGALSRAGVPSARVRVLVPAVRPHTPSGPPALALPRPVVGAVARLVPSKGVDVLLAALPGLPGVSGLVVGDGPERPRLAAQARRLGSRVVLAGWRADARDLLPGLDVLAVPSRSDGSPLVVLEALAAGVPVVASRVGGLPDQLCDGVEGLLVPPDDVEALAQALRGLLADPARRAAMSRAGRARAAAGSHDAMVDALERLYAEAAARRRLLTVPRPAPDVAAWSRTGAAPAT